MRRATYLVAALFCFALTARTEADQPYGIDRRELNEPFLNRRMPASEAGPFPQKLSETGAFESVKDLKPMRTLIPYKVNTILWSDGTDKTRWLFVPKDAKIGFTLSNWSFPVGTVFVKHFDIVINQQGSTTTSRRLETRFLVVDGSTNVYGVTYKWRADNSDADLLHDGLDEAIMITNNATVRTQMWHYPSPSQCLQCHTKESGGAQNKGVLGVKTAQQNSDFNYPSGTTDNQLRTMNHIGLFSPALNEADIPTMPKMAALTDTNASLELRVRSYLDANCAHCHSPDGAASSYGAAFDARFHIPLPEQEIVNTEKNYIKFRDPAKSYILQYDSDRGGSTQMPPLGTAYVDTGWTNLLTQWIMSAFNPTNAEGSAVGDSVKIKFNGVPEAASGQLAGNYQLVGNGQTNTLSNGTLDGPNRTITFDVTPALTAGEAYEITVNNVLDQATPQNRVWPNSVLKFVAQGGLIGPANDNFNNAANLVGSDAAAAGENCTAGVEAGEPDHGGNPGGHSVWWSWIAPSNGPVTIDTLGSTFDTVLAVYTGGSVSNLMVVATNDDLATLEASRVIFTAVAGETYQIAVDGYEGDCGGIVITLHQGPLPQPPDNDLFDLAEVLPGDNGSIFAANNFATKEPGEPNHGHNSGGASVWWTWTAPVDGDVTFDTHGSSFDTTLGVYLGNTVNVLTLVAENDDDGADQTSIVQFTAAAGTTYHIAVDGYYGRTGNIQLNYLLSPAPILLPASIQAVPLDGKFQLQLNGPVGADVEIQASDDLVHWQTISNSVLSKNNALSGNALQISEPISNSIPQRFYRAVRHVSPPAP